MSNDKSGFTIRAMLIFIFFIVLVGMWTQRNELVYGGPKLSDHVPPAGWNRRPCSSASDRGAAAEAERKTRSRQGGAGSYIFCAGHLAALSLCGAGSQIPAGAGNELRALALLPRDGEVFQVLRVYPRMDGSG